MDYRTATVKNEPPSSSTSRRSCTTADTTTRTFARLRQRRHQGHHHLPRPWALRADPARAPPSPRNALGPQRGQGCRDCRGFNAQAEIRRKRFVAKALATHGDRYDYTDVVYLDARTDVTVNCSEHGAFSVRPDNHTSKYATGCPTAPSHLTARHRGQRRSQRKASGGTARQGRSPDGSGPRAARRPASCAVDRSPTTRSPQRVSTGHVVSDGEACNQPAAGERLTVLHRDGRKSKGHCANFCRG